VPYCTNCGTQERDNQRFCAVCGAPTPGSLIGSALPPPSPGGSNYEAQVLVGISMDPPRHSRWSVLFRLILAFPLIVVFLGIGVAASFVVIAAWFGALFTGRVPDNMQRFLTKALRYYSNIQGYAYLLTSRWPGFVFDAKPDDQVTIEVDHVNLRRWSVFFRFILAYPAMLVGTLLGSGSYPLLVLMWLWGVVSGREPRAFHQAAALVLRFQLRLFAYVGLLTPTQPFRGFLGDDEEQKTPAAETLPAASRETSLAGGAVGAPSSSATPTTQAPLATRWLVTKTAKVVMVLVLVIGLPTYFVTSFVDNPVLSRLKAAISRTLITTSHNVTVATMNQFEVSVNACLANNSQSCISNAASEANSLLDAQSSLLSGNAFVPQNALNQAVRYELALDNLESELLVVQTSQSLQAQTYVISNEIPKALSRCNSDYRALEARLTN